MYSCTRRVKRFVVISVATMFSALNAFLQVKRAVPNAIRQIDMAGHSKGEVQTDMSSSREARIVGKRISNVY